MPDFSTAQDAEERLELVRTAVCEASQIVDALDAAVAAEGWQSGLWRGMYLRLDTLLSVAISVTSGDDLHATADLRAEVFGTRERAEEVSHG